LATKATKTAVITKLIGVITKGCEAVFGTGFKVLEIKSQSILVRLGDQLIEIKFTFKRDEDYSGKYLNNFKQVVSGKYE